MKIKYYNNIYIKNIILFFIILMICIFYFFKIKKQIENNQNMNKKYLLSLLVICKNESMIIEEFIEHYKWQGIEHIYFIDNNSDDNTYDIIKPYIDINYISYYFLPEQHAQVKNYNIVYNDIKNESQWLIVCDSDEFIYNRNKGSNIYDYIKSLDYNITTAVLLNWKMFGSSGFKEQPQSIRKSFTWKKENIAENIKSILNVNFTDSIGVHTHHYNNNNNLISNPPELAMNHYAIMSEEYFKKTKMTRGDVSGYVNDNFRDMNYFNSYDFKEVEDTELKNLLM